MVYGKNGVKWVVYGKNGVRWVTYGKEGVKWVMYIVRKSSSGWRRVRKV